MPTKDVINIKFLQQLTSLLHPETITPLVQNAVYIDWQALEFRLKSAMEMVDPLAFWFELYDDDGSPGKADSLERIGNLMMALGIFYAEDRPSTGNVYRDALTELSNPRGEKGAAFIGQCWKVFLQDDDKALQTLRQEEPKLEKVIDNLRFVLLVAEIEEQFRFAKAKQNEAMDRALTGEKPSPKDEFVTWVLGHNPNYADDESDIGIGSVLLKDLPLCQTT